MSQITVETEIEKRRAELCDMAKNQGVKPVQKVEDLYGDFADDVDIDEFLEIIREIRNSDENSKN
ncbi:MAG TPA: hypothetical protein VF571_09505 [Pyrinomonadaceae bacterium]|jgi:hypothetical protein